MTIATLLAYLKQIYFFTTTQHFTISNASKKGVWSLEKFTDINLLRPKLTQRARCSNPKGSLILKNQTVIARPLPYGLVKLRTF